MDNTFDQWQVDPTDDTKVISGAGLDLCLSYDPAIAAWITERLNYAARAEIKLSQLGTAFNI